METSSRKSLYVFAAFLLVLVLGSYSNSFNAGFQYDDFHQLVKNANIRTLGNIPGFFTNASIGSYFAGSKGYRPLTTASFAVNYALSGYDVRAYHAVNLLLHFINALLVFLIVAAVLKSAGRENQYGIALVASLIFAVHPIQTNAVTYISGRAVLLASVFTLTAFYCFMRYRSAADARTAFLWAAASVFSFIAGLMSKEMAASFIGIVLAYDAIFTLPKRRGIAGRAKAALAYLPHAAGLGGYLFIRRALMEFATVSDASPDRAVYLMSEAKVFLIYLRLLVLPMNQNADYALSYTVKADWLVVLSAVVVVAAVVLLYRLRTKTPAAAFFGFWFLLALAPESSLFPILDTAEEYRLYLPSVGFIAMLVVLGAVLLNSPGARRSFAAFLIVVFGLLTFHRNAVWATEYSLWSDVAKKSPYSARAHSYLGRALLLEKRYLKAVEELRACLRLDPSYPQAYGVYNNIGLCLMGAGMNAEALEQFKVAVKLYPYFTEGYANMGTALNDMGRYGEAVEAFRKALSIDPGFVYASNELATAYLKLGRDDDAVKTLEDAATRSPMSYSVHYNLALLYDGKGLSGQAISQARSALGLAGNEADRQRAQELLLRIESPKPGG
jgi:protein O-mannosyl-transferase